MSKTVLSTCIPTFFVACVALHFALRVEAQEQAAGPTSNPFFAFCMDTHDAKKRTLAQQAKMLRQLGFDGAGHVGLDNVPQRLRTLDQAGLRLFLVGLRVDLASQNEPYPPKVKKVLPLLKGRDVAMYVTIGGMKPADPWGDRLAVPILRELADAARASGVRVVLYPHTGDWLVHVDQAVRLAEQVDRPNLGVIFNLCHFLRNEDEKTLRPVIERAMPHLFMVSLNGADTGGKSEPGWSRLIQPLDQGTFDVYGLLNTLKDLGYTGPIALMCYGIGGDAQKHLARSISQWRRWQARLRTETRKGVRNLFPHLTPKPQALRSVPHAVPRGKVPDPFFS